MADQPPLSKHYTSLFTSPRLRFFLTSKITPFDSDFSLVSPTSILEPNPSSIFSSKNPKPCSFFEPAVPPNPQRFHFHPPDVFGLADLVTNRDHSRKHVNKMVLFASKLRVQIPCTDFGTKTGAQRMRYPGHGHRQLLPRVHSKVPAVSDIDMSEDYTRVMTHGPNPTITHIFDNSVFMEATPCSLPLPSPLDALDPNKTQYYLTYCYTCKKNLDQKHDIYIYRGEKGFCSSECRYQEMLLDQMET